jgi:nicotinamide-nucleotide adenylyltransferase
MATRLSAMRNLLPTIKSGLNSFTTSQRNFELLRSVIQSSDGVSIAAPQPPFSASTLLILDSSYNPPSRAHLALASSALSKLSSASSIRLLLLFSTHNADKAPSPASFVQRIAMMIVFAEDLQRYLSSKSSEAAKVPIDVGLTKAPYYTDKSTAIAEADPPVYPGKPTHVHLLGYDTLTRFLAPKYYKDFDPPLSALSPYFGAGHRLLVLLRPDSSSDNAVTGDTEEEQRKNVSDLSKGSLEKAGFKPEWAKQVELLEGDAVAEAAGVSSTVIRKAAKRRDWKAVGDMCTPGVAAWIREMGLYEDDSSGAKMA